MGPNDLDMSAVDWVIEHPGLLSLFQELGIDYGCGGKSLRAACQERDLSLLDPQQYNVLRLLKAEHPSGVNTLDLASRLVSRAPDITRMLDKLEQRGLVTRDRPADNRRTVRIAITAAGIALLKKMAGPVRECHERQLGHLSQKDLQTLVSLLQSARRPHEAVDSTWL
jgi:DNA-binding MarR family transcriptional regulator